MTQTSAPPLLSATRAATRIEKRASKALQWSRLTNYVLCDLLLRSTRDYDWVCGSY